MENIPKQQAVKEHFDEVAGQYDYWKQKNAYYYNNIKTFIHANIRPGARVLEVGCGTGSILASTRPSYGVGIDISPEMIRRAVEKYPQYTFYASPIEDFSSDEQFDYIIMVDVVDHVFDITDVFASVYRLCHPRTKILLTTINPWWDPILGVMEKLKAKMPEGPHNFIEKRHIGKLLDLMNFTVNYSGYLMLFPKKVPVLSYLANTLGTRLWPVNKLAAAQYMIIQPRPENRTDMGYGCSVIIPCHNEEGSIADAVRRIPKMGKRTEIIVVNDGSSDRTADIVTEMQHDYPDLRLIEYAPNRGKGYAVRQGFDVAQEEILMILDADLSVAPEELPRFFTPLNQSVCDFVNGTRLVYPMEAQAMRSLNLIGNKLFSLTMSFITRQDLSDTLCGTKAFYKTEYRYYRMGLDRWGDYDLLFSAARRGNKIMEVPVHYKERAAGESKMKTFRHGIHLLQACWKGFQELVFVPPDRVPANSVNHTTQEK